MILKRTLGLGAVLAAAMLLIPAAASATTLYPAGDAISFSNGGLLQTYVTVSDTAKNIAGVAGTTCDVGIPPVTLTNSSGSGTVTNTLPGDVSFRSCLRLNGDIKTFGNTGVGGNWTIGVGYAPNTVTFGYPADGLAVATTDGCTYENSSAGDLTGYWANGYGAPVNATTSIAMPSGAVNMTAVASWNGSCTNLGNSEWFYINGTDGYSTLTDTSNPSDLPLLGP